MFRFYNGEALKREENIHKSLSVYAICLRLFALESKTLEKFDQFRILNKINAKTNRKFSLGQPKSGFGSLLILK